MVVQVNWNSSHKFVATTALALAALVVGVLAAVLGDASHASRRALVKSMNDVMAVKNAPPAIAVQVGGNGGSQ